MRPIRVVQVAPPGNPHAACLDECAALVTAALFGLGHQVQRAYNTTAHGVLNVVVGWHLLDGPRALDGAECVAWQLEAIGAEGSGWWTPAREAVLRAFDGVWDFDARNLAFLRSRGFARSAWLPLGHHAALATLPAGVAEDVDVVAYGSVNSRRHAALEACRAAGLSVRQVPFGTYGAERDAAIASARCVLGVNFYPALARFDQVRAAHLVANGHHYVVEGASSAWAPSSMYAIAAPHDDLVDTCVRVCRDGADSRRADGAERARRFAVDHPMTRYVAAALAAHARNYVDA